MTITTIALILVAAGSVLSVACTPTKSRSPANLALTMVRGAGLGVLLSAILLLAAIVAGVTQP